MEPWTRSPLRRRRTIRSQGALALGDPRLADAARDAFLTGMHTAALVAAAVALGGALVALVFLPSRERVGAREVVAA